MSNLVVEKKEDFLKKSKEGFKKVLRLKIFTENGTIRGGLRLQT
jgi:hypothetical protein